MVMVENDLDRLSNHAVNLIRAGKFDKAEEVCLRLIAEYPDQVDGLERLAMLYEARGEMSKAAEFCEKAVRFMETREGFDPEMIAILKSDAERLRGT